MMQAAEAEQLKLFFLRSWLLLFWLCVFKLIVFLRSFLGIIAVNRFVCRLLLFLLPVDALVLLASRGDKQAQNTASRHHKQKPDCIFQVKPSQRHEVMKVLNQSKSSKSTTMNSEQATNFTFSWSSSIFFSSS